MKNYDFSVIASGLNPQADDFEARFYDGNCSDCTVSFQRGHIILDFAREAETLEDAICSAVEDAIAAGCKIERIEPDPLVSLSDIAARTGMSRVAMTNYAKGQRGTDFPAPSVKITSDSPLWVWADVAIWLFRNDKIDIDQAIDAETVRQANALLATGEQHLNKELTKRVASRVAELEACG